MQTSVFTFTVLFFFLQNLPFFSWQKTSPEQPLNAGSENFCATSEMMEKAFLQSPELKKRHDEIEHQASNFFLNHLKSPGADLKILPEFTLPVVVHIIHQNGAENIPDTQVLQGIQHLNEAFANTGYYDQATGVNTQIQFCLAKRDPDGNATTGINRVVSPLTNMNLGSDDLPLKDLIRWDPLHYINIWLVKNINGSVIGYAYLPAAHGGPHDGIVMEASYFGSSYANSAVQVHEMGHYLGLYHTFEGGCTNDDCILDGDRVCDTPPDNSTAPVPCSTTANSCNTDSNSGFPSDQNDMFWNYMDYGDFDCYSAYTQGQTERMDYFIENVRFSLLESEGCNDPCLSPVTASFTASTTIVNIGGTVNFTNTTTGGTTWQWQIDGMDFSTSVNAVYTFNNEGTFEITLLANNADPNCSAEYSLSVEVVCPVGAGFSTSNFYPAPGETVDFTNTSTSATAYQWSVNGTPAGNAVDFSQTFASAGSNTICLEASNGLCTEEFCQLVFVIQDNSGECVGSYLRQLGSEGVVETANTIIPTPEGNFLIGGRRENESMLMLVSPEGETLWARAFDFTNGDDFLWRMFLDSDGMLVASGRDQLNSNTTNYVIKYDYQNDNMLWSRQFTNPSFTRFEGMVEKEPGGNYIIFGVTNEGQENNLLLEIDRNTGASVWMKKFDFGNTDVFLSAIIHQGELYLAGVQRSGGLNKIRASIGKYDLSGNQIWTRFYYNTLNETARSYIYDHLIENDTIVAFSRGDLTGSSFTNVSVHLLKTDMDGNAYWAKSYDIAGSNTEFTESLIQLPDGYILQGSHLTANRGEFFFIRVDKQGNLIWAKSVSGLEGDWGNQAIQHDGFIYFTGRSPDYDPGAMDIVFGKMTLDGEVSGDGCTLVSDISVTVSDIPNPYDGQHPLNELNAPFNLTTTSFSPDDVNLSSAEFPGCECQQSIDTCANGALLHLVPDAVITVLDARCVGDSMQVSVQVCNQDSVALPAGTPATLYGGNPTTGPAAVLTTLTLPMAIGPNDCISFESVILPVINQPVFMVVNDAGSTPTPFDLEYDFPNTEVEECDYTNNMTNFTFNYTPPVLDLGNDTSACHFETTTLDAGPGFASYYWFDGSTEQTWTAWEPGTYWVEVTDSCGGVQADSIGIWLDPGTVVDIGYDTVEICQGESFTFSVNGFDDYQWTPAGFLDCSNCPVVTTTPDTSITYILVASTDEGCISVDTVAVLIVTDTADVTYTESICEGDSIEFFGTWLVQPGDYEYFENTGSCVVHYTLTLDLAGQPAIELLVTLPTCSGFSDGSLDVNGNIGGLEFSLGGTNFQSENHFGNLVAGDYTLYFKNSNECLFSLDFTIDAAPEVFVNLPEDITIELGESVEIDAITSPGIVSYIWTPGIWLSCDDCQNPTAQPEETTLYTLLVANPNDCTAQDSMLITVEFTPKVYVPNAFSPNNDGINDEFYLFGDGIAEVRLLRIFDRWGEMVYEKTNFPPNDPLYGWDGKFKGKPMNSDVFAYYAIVGFIDGSEEIVKGDLTLLR
jgi:gliding motility-associated-like protein